MRLELTRSPRWRAVLIALLAMNIASCAQLPKGSPSSASYQIGTDCEELAESVDLPNVEGLRRSAALGRMAGVIGEANANLDATRECQANQRGRLARGGAR